MASLLSILLAACAMADATSFYVSETGTFAGSDTAGALVAPNGTFKMTFVVPSNPVPIGGTVTSLGFDVPVFAFSYFLNGVQLSVVPSEIRFNGASNGGLFDITFGTGLTADEFSFQGAQAYTGTTTAPVFSTGNLSLASWTYSDPANYDAETPANASVSVSATPEPSSAALSLSVLLIVTAFAVCRKALLAS